MRAMSHSRSRFDKTDYIYEVACTENVNVLGGLMLVYVHAINRAIDGAYSRQ